MLDRGFSRLSSSTFALGILLGTFRNPSISSEKHIIFDFIKGSSIFRADLTIEVLATSPKVPI